MPGEAPLISRETLQGTQMVVCEIFQLLERSTWSTEVIFAAANSQKPFEEAMWLGVLRLEDCILVHLLK